MPCAGFLSICSSAGFRHQPRKFVAPVEAVSENVSSSRDIIGRLAKPKLECDPIPPESVPSATSLSIPPLREFAASSASDAAATKARSENVAMEKLGDCLRRIFPIHPENDPEAGKGRPGQLPYTAWSDNPARHR
jgi:hypothetical protein